ncbi:MAG: translesion error-prone DNA polymerase V autoproteolytic subunit [Bacteroidota bacterium]|nr:translesion error-prone DNA polymerase V autoproteolytic subunit [Bacteroidota bacterium]
MEDTTKPDKPTIIVPFALSPVHAGFPSPADDYMERDLDLNALLIRHKDATFYVRVAGDSMEGVGIFEGDVLVIDKAEIPAHNTVVIAMINGEFTVKRLYQKGSEVYLVPANPKYRAIRITEAMQFQVWGVVTYCIHRMK